MTKHTNQEEFTGSTTIVAMGDNVSCDLSGEVVVLGMKQGIYYSLTPVAARIWELIQKPQDLSTIRDTIVEEYEVAPDHCERDLIVLLSDLRRHNLARIVDDTSH